MTGDRPDDFDDLAARSRDRALRDAEAIADVESALAQVRSGTAAPPAALSASRRRVVLAAAAVVAVMTVSAAVWLARDSDEQIATSPVTTPPEGTAVEATVPPTAPPTTGPAATDPPTIVAPTTEPVETDEVPDQCLAEPVAPPALVDGSEPGEGSEGWPGGEVRAVGWGGRSFYAMYQILDVDVDRDTFAAANGVVVGDHEAWVLPVGDPPLGAINLYWQDPSGCVRWYTIASGLMVDEALDYLTRWLTSVDTGEDFVRAFDPDFDAPTEYVAVRLVEAQFDDVRRLAPDGTDLGSHADVASFVDDRLPEGARLADGRRLEPARYGRGTARCVNDAVTIDGELLHPDLNAARAVNATPDGIVIAARDVCPDGATWGDPGTRWELVRVDFRQPAPEVEVLLARAADPFADGERHSARMDGSVGVSAISPGGRLVALSEFTGGERPEWTIRSLTSPDTVIASASRCADPGPIVAAPVFLTDQRVVLVRACPDGAAEAMLVETVDIDSGVVDHSVEVADLAEWSEFRLITLSAIVDSGETWSMVSIGDLDRATTAILVRGDDATEITQPGFRTYAFTIDDLARR